MPVRLDFRGLTLRRLLPTLRIGEGGQATRRRLGQQTTALVPGNLNGRIDSKRFSNGLPAGGLKFTCRINANVLRAVGPNRSQFYPLRNVRSGHPNVSFLVGLIHCAGLNFLGLGVCRCRGEKRHKRRFD